jgi:hypothetical protein
MAFRGHFVALKHMTEAACPVDQSLVKANLAQVDVLTLQTLVASAPDRLHSTDVAPMVHVQDVLLK